MSKIIKKITNAFKSKKQIEKEEKLKQEHINALKALMKDINTFLDAADLKKLIGSVDKISGATKYDEKIYVVAEKSSESLEKINDGIVDKISELFEDKSISKSKNALEGVSKFLKSALRILEVVSENSIRQGGDFQKEVAEKYDKLQASSKVLESAINKIEEDGAAFAIKNELKKIIHSISDNLNDFAKKVSKQENFNELLEKLVPAESEADDSENEPATPFTALAKKTDKSLEKYAKDTINKETLTKIKKILPEFSLIGESLIRSLKNKDGLNDKDKKVIDEWAENYGLYCEKLRDYAIRIGRTKEGDTFSKTASIKAVQKKYEAIEKLKTKLRKTVRKLSGIDANDARLVEKAMDSMETLYTCINTGKPISGGKDDDIKDDPKPAPKNSLAEKGLEKLKEMAGGKGVNISDEERRNALNEIKSRAMSDDKNARKVLEDLKNNGETDAIKRAADVAVIEVGRANIKKKANALDQMLQKRNSIDDVKKQKLGVAKPGKGDVHQNFIKRELDKANIDENENAYRLALTILDEETTPEEKTQGENDLLALAVNDVPAMKVLEILAKFKVPVGVKYVAERDKENTNLLKTYFANNHINDKALIARAEKVAKGDKTAVLELVTAASENGAGGNTSNALLTFIDGNAGMQNKMGGGLPLAVANAIRGVAGVDVAKRKLLVQAAGIGVDNATRDKAAVQITIESILNDPASDAMHRVNALGNLPHQADFNKLHLLQNQLNGDVNNDRNIAKICVDASGLGGIIKPEERNEALFYLAKNGILNDNINDAFRSLKQNWNSFEAGYRSLFRSMRKISRLLNGQKAAVQALGIDFVCKIAHIGVSNSEFHKAVIQLKDILLNNLANPAGGADPKRDAAVHIVTALQGMNPGGFEPAGMVQGAMNGIQAGNMLTAPANNIGAVGASLNSLKQAFATINGLSRDKELLVWAYQAVDIGGTRAAALLNLKVLGALGGPRGDLAMRVLALIDVHAAPINGLAGGITNDANAAHAAAQHDRNDATMIQAKARFGAVKEGKEKSLGICVAYATFDDVTIRTPALAELKRLGLAGNVQARDALRALSNIRGLDKENDVKVALKLVDAKVALRNNLTKDGVTKPEVMDLAFTVADTARPDNDRRGAMTTLRDRSVGGDKQCEKALNILIKDADLRVMKEELDEVAVEA